MTEIWRDFDPNLDIPVDLKNVRVISLPDAIRDIPDINAGLDIQNDTLDDDDSEIDDDVDENELGVPGTYVIVSQTIHILRGGTQVVDVVLDIEEIEGASKYEVRVTK